MDLNVAVTGIPFCLEVYKTKNGTNIDGYMKYVMFFLEKMGPFKINYTVFQYYTSTSIQRTNFLTKQNVDLVFWMEPIHPRSLGLYKYSNPYFHCDVMFFTGPPRETQASAYDGLLIWGYQMYILIGVFCFVVASLVAFADYLTELKTGSKLENNIWIKVTVLRTLESAWEIASMFFAEPVIRIPKQFAARFMVGTWFLAVFILVTFFGAYTKSSFSVTVYQKIDTISDLVKRLDVRPVILKGEAEETEIQKTLDKSRQKLWKRIHEDKGSLIKLNFFTPKTLNGVSKGDIAMIDYPGRWCLFLQIMRSRGFKAENVYMGKEPIATFQSGFMISNKISPAAMERINIAMLVVAETLYYEYHLKQRVYILESSMWEQPNKEVKKLNLEDMKGAFFIWLFFCGICTSVFTVEIMWKCQQKIRKKLIKKRKISSLIETEAYSGIFKSTL